MGDRLIGDLALGDVEATRQVRIVIERLLSALVRQRGGKGQGGVASSKDEFVEVEAEAEAGSAEEAKS